MTNESLPGAQRKILAQPKTLAFAVAGILGITGAARASSEFYMGSDVSLLSWEQQEGMTFHDTNGIAGLADQILYNHGDNLFRLRIFVNPNTNYAVTGGAIQNQAYDIALAQQIKADDPSAKFLLDFHYSDTWADPGHQATPAAWTGQSLSTLETTVKSYTTSTINAFQTAGVQPDMVQVGNEINGGMLWNTGAINFNGTVSQQETSWAAFGGLVNSAIAGVRAAQGSGPKIQVAIHIANGDVNGEPQYFFGDLTNPSYGNVPTSSYDVMGFSYYPTATNNLATLSSNLTAVDNTYNKKIMVLETNAPWESTSVASDPAYPDTQAGQQKFLTDLASTVQNLPNNNGLGVVYWYPESVQVPGQYDYNGGATALFDNSSGHTATLGVNAFSVTQHQWQSSASQDWNTSGNWTTSIPNGPGVEADFLSAANSTPNISTSTAITLGTMRFNGATSYVIGGSGSLTLQESIGSAYVVVQQGTQQINLPLTIASYTNFNVASGASLQITQPITIAANQSLIQSGTGGVTYSSDINLAAGASASFSNSSHATSLTLAGGATAILGSASTVFEVDSLSNNGTINLQGSTLLINYGANPDPIAAIQAQLTSGYNFGAWNGTDIQSSTAAAGAPSYGIGFVDSADGISSPGLSSGQIKIEYTLYGDLNLDGNVNGTDFSIFASNFGRSGATWDQGDLNYDGEVNGSDFALLAANFGKSSSGTSVVMPASSWAALDAFAAAHGLTSDLPEPASAGVVTFGALGMTARRRRRR
jgi:arabinogalactan endo-1,4-beta-galactosidase